MATILVVDDSSTDTYHYQTMLEGHGYRVITATNGQDAIERAKLEKPEVILMDIVMPGMNGFQATRQITNNPKTADIPVIIVSNKDQDSDRAWGLRQGARDYIVKGSPEEALVGKIRSVLAGAK
jgi:twitching motility two-component system response regulator PilH